jgi:hypothetical protein
MNREPIAREWLRIVRYFKSQARARHRGQKRHDARAGTSEGVAQKHAKEL